MTCEHLEKGPDFLRGRVLRHVIDSELLRTKADTFRYPPRDDADLDPRLSQEMDPEAVLDIVALELDALFRIAIRDAAEVDATVGQDAVDVETNELDATRDF